MKKIALKHLKACYVQPEILQPLIERFIPPMKIIKVLMIWMAIGQPQNNSLFLSLNLVM